VTGLHLRGGEASQAGGYSGFGGGLFVGSGVITLTHNQIYSNTATHGGAIYNQGGTVLATEEEYLVNYGIFSNTATYGGAIYSSGGQTTVDRLEIRSNQPPKAGTLSRHRDYAAEKQHYPGQQRHRQRRGYLQQRGRVNRLA
jgi:hypothetical protein